VGLDTPDLVEKMNRFFLILLLLVFGSFTEVKCSEQNSSNKIAYTEPQPETDEKVLYDAPPVANRTEDNDSAPLTLPADFNGKDNPKLTEKPIVFVDKPMPKNVSTKLALLETDTTSDINVTSSSPQLGSSSELKNRPVFNLFLVLLIMLVLISISILTIFVFTILKQRDNRIHHHDFI
jgi:hypothetical protein